MLFRSLEITLLEGETGGGGLAPQVGLEPTTLRLTAECSTIELLRIRVYQDAGLPRHLSDYNKFAESVSIDIHHFVDNVSLRAGTPHSVPFGSHPATLVGSPFGWVTAPPGYHLWHQRNPNPPSGAATPTRPSCRSTGTMAAAVPAPRLPQQRLLGRRHPLPGRRHLWGAHTLIGNIAESVRMLSNIASICFTRSGCCPAMLLASPGSLLRS